MHLQIGSFIIKKNLLINNDLSFNYKQARTIRT